MEPALLGYQDRLTLDVLKWDLRQQMRALDLYWLDFPISPYYSPFMLARRSMASYRFERPEDMDAYLTLLGQYPRLVNQIRQKLVLQ